MNSSAATATNATKMPIWMIFMWDILPSQYYATIPGSFSFLIADG
jgi:hypothetical protein